MSLAISADVRRLTLGDWNPALFVAPDLLLFVGGSGWVAAKASRSVAVVVLAWTLGVAIALAAYGLIEREAGWGVVLMVAAAGATTLAAATVWFGELPTKWFFVGPFAFRPSSAADSATHARRSLTQLVVFWTAFFVVIPLIVVALERRLLISAAFLDRPIWTPVGWGLFASGSALGLWSCLTMAIVGRGTPLPAQTARELVVRGPYRLVRNPMAVAGAVQTAAIGLIVGSWIVVVLAGAGAVVWNIVIRPAEEADLASRFGDDYDRYCSEVRCWLP